MSRPSLQAALSLVGATFRIIFMVLEECFERFRRRLPAFRKRRVSARAFERHPEVRGGLGNAPMIPNNRWN